MYRFLSFWTFSHGLDLGYTHSMVLFSRGATWSRASWSRPSNATLNVSLRLQIVILKRGQHIKIPPYAFTEQGVAMLSGVLHSERAIQVNVAIMRAFVKLREMIASHRDLARRLSKLERKYDEQFRGVFDAIRELMEPPVKSKPRIGFHLHKK